MIFLYNLINFAGTANKMNSNSFDSRSEKKDLKIVECIFFEFLNK